MTNSRGASTREQTGKRAKGPDGEMGDKSSVENELKVGHDVCFQGRLLAAATACVSTNLEFAPQFPIIDDSVV